MRRKAVLWIENTDEPSDLEAPIAALCDCLRVSESAVAVKRIHTIFIVS